MRIVVVHPGPDFSVQDVHAGWVEGLRALGQQVIEYPFNDALSFFDKAHMPVADGYRKAVDDPEAAIGLARDGLAALLWRAQPELLLVVSGFLVPGDFLDHARRLGTRVAILHTESPYEDQRQLDLAAHADLNLLNDPTNMREFNLQGPTVYMPHAYRPSVHKPGPRQPELASEFVLVGTGFPSRIHFLEQMDLDGIDVALAGQWQALADDSPLRKHLAHDIAECLDNTDTVRLYQSSRVGINLYRRDATDSPEHITGWSMGPREVEMAACGLFFLRDPRPEGDQAFPMLPTFTSPAEASELLRWWLAHDDARLAAAAAAREAIGERTFTNHAARLMRLLESK